MADSLYLSLWFPSFDEAEILARTVSVLRQIPFSAARGGVTYSAVQPVSWSEPTILERRYRPGVAPEEAVAEVAEFLHDDYAYVFEAYWDLWTPPEGAEKWVLEPALIRLTAHGLEFEEHAAEETGHIQIDFGLDMSFLHEEVELRLRRSATSGATCRSWWNLPRRWKKMLVQPGGCCGRSRKKIWRKS